MNVKQVRNNHLGPLVLEIPTAGGKEEFKWGGFGNARQDDIQEIPEHVLESVNFRKLVSRRIVTLLDDHSADKQIEASTELWIAKQEADRQANLSSLDRTQDNDIVGLGCIGPGEKGSLCNEKVLVRNSERNVLPPLCTLHKHFESQFVPIEADGATKWQFVQI